MTEMDIRYISGQDGRVKDVIVPIDMFKKMVEELEDKELLGMMKEIEEKSPGYLTEKESFDLLDSLLENNEIQAQ